MAAHPIRKSISSVSWFKNLKSSTSVSTAFVEARRHCFATWVRAETSRRLKRGEVAAGEDHDQLPVLPSALQAREHLVALVNRLPH